MVKYQVTSIDGVTARGIKGSLSSREVLVTLLAGSDRVQLQMPDTVAARLVEKLEGLKLPPSGASAVKKL